MPFTVITCADMLLVNLERVGFNLRNFDMTIVFKVRSAYQAHIVQHFLQFPVNLSDTLLEPPPSNLSNFNTLIVFMTRRLSWTHT